MLNTVAIMGCLTRAPELRRTPKGTAVCSFCVAVQRNTGDEADFIDCVAWSGTAEFIDKYFSKGSRIIVQGRLQTRTWEQDGKTRKATEIVADLVYFGSAKSEWHDTDEVTPYD